MNFMEAKVYKHRTLPSFLEFSYLIASLIREYVRKVENKQKVSEESKVISKFIHKSNDTLFITEAQSHNQGLFSFTLYSNSLVNWFLIINCMMKIYLRTHSE